MKAKTNLAALRANLEAALAAVKEHEALQTTTDEWNAEIARLEARILALNAEEATARRLLAEAKAATDQHDQTRQKAHEAAESTIATRIEGLLAQERGLEQQIAQQRAELDQAVQARRAEEAAHVRVANDMKEEILELGGKLNAAKTRLEQFKRSLAVEAC